MPEPQRVEKASIWETAGTRIGVISAAVGLVIALVGLPHAVATAFGQGDSPSSAELDERRAALAEAAPRLDVRYVFLSADIALGITDLRLGNSSDDPPPKQPPAVTSILSLPTVATEPLAQLTPIYDRVIENRGRGGCRLGRTAQISAAYLVITNRGRRDASNISLEADRLVLPAEVRVTERPAPADDYVAQLRARAASSGRITLDVPMTLAPGDGVRVPLFVTDAPPSRFDLWCVASRTALLPRSLRYDDPILGKTSRSQVRRMETPTILAPGAYGRG
jgi:hypothetical protein